MLEEPLQSQDFCHKTSVTRPKPHIRERPWFMEENFVCLDWGKLVLGTPNITQSTRLEKIARS